MCINSLPGVDHGTSDQGASLLTSKRLASAMGSQSRRKGTNIFFCSFFNVILVIYFETTTPKKT